MIIEPCQIQGDITENCDVCVIGSGAGGAVIAKELSEKGLSVVILEKGGYYQAGDFIQRENEIRSKLYEDGFARFTNTDIRSVAFSKSPIILIIQAHCVGGSTVINDAVCYRTPELILKEWEEDHNVTGFTKEELEPLFEKVEKNIHVVKVRDNELNKNNKKLQKGTEVLGYKGHTTRRNTRKCAQCGYCHLGCHYNRKQTMLLTYVPQALENGAKMYVNCEVRRIVYKNGRVEGVIARIQDDNCLGSVVTRLKVYAKIVIVACGAIGSSQLLLKSRIPNKYNRIGKKLSLHPFPYVFAEFEEDISGYSGIPIGYSCDEFSVLSYREGREKPPGYLIEGIAEHPAASAFLLTNFSGNHKELMKEFNHYAGMMIVLHDKPSGTISINNNGNAVIRYELDKEDEAKIISGLKNAARIYFAAGAKKVITNHFEPIVLRSEKDFHLLDKHGLRKTNILLTSAHPQGGNIMGDDPKKAVVNSNCESHHVKNLFVSDASVFPTSVGVNPQLTIMCNATRIANYIIGNK